MHGNSRAPCDPVGIPDQGLGAAIAVITFIVLAIFVIPTLRLTQSKGDI